MRLPHLILLATTTLAALATGGIANATNDERLLSESVTLAIGAKKDYCGILQNKKRQDVCETGHDVLIKQLELCLAMAKLRRLESTGALDAHDVALAMAVDYASCKPAIQRQTSYLGKRYFVPSKQPTSKPSAALKQK